MPTVSGLSLVCFDAFRERRIQGQIQILLVRVRRDQRTLDPHAERTPGDMIFGEWPWALGRCAIQHRYSRAGNSNCDKKSQQKHCELHSCAGEINLVQDWIPQLWVSGTRSTGMRCPDISDRPFWPRISRIEALQVRDSTGKLYPQQLTRVRDRLITKECKMRHRSVNEHSLLCDFVMH